MSKYLSSTIWLVAISAVIIVAMLSFPERKPLVNIEDIRWEDQHTTCTVSFIVANNTDKEQSVVVQVIAERTRESRVGTAISFVGDKTVEATLPPRHQEQVKCSFPLATAYAGSLVVRCVLAR